MKTKKHIYATVALIALFFGFSAFSGKPGQQPPPPLTMERGGTAAFTIGDKGYVGTGDYKNDLWMYDPATNAWTQKASLGKTGRRNAVGFSIGSMGYIGMGMMKDAGDRAWAVHDFYEYNPARNTWRAQADFGGSSGGDRRYATAFAIGSAGFAGTGYGCKDFYAYDRVTDVWSRIADLGSGGGNLKSDEAPEAINEGPSLTVFPNPSGTDFNFRLGSQSDEPATVRIYDLSGRLAGEYLSLSPAGIMKAGEELKPGIYVAVLTQGGFRATGKITKTN